MCAVSKLATELRNNSYICSSLQIGSEVIQHLNTVLLPCKTFTLATVFFFFAGIYNTICTLKILLEIPCLNYTSCSETINFGGKTCL